MQHEAWDIQLKNLTVGYGRTKVLEQVDGLLPSGKISVILGRSGCGKSTLLRHMLALQSPMQGEILLGEHNMFSLKKKTFRRIRRRMGVLFQDGALLGSLTLGQNVGLPLSEHTNFKKSVIREIVMLKLELVGLEDFYDYYPSQLSGGMRKRAGLARAIVMDPPILFCDEPTSGLDPISSAQMDELLLSMKKQLGVTIVVVSHDLESMDAIADHVMILGEGKALFSGTVGELKATTDPFLRRFLDRKAM